MQPKRPTRNRQAEGPNGSTRSSANSRNSSARLSNDELDALVKKIVRQTLEREGLREKSHVSSKSYSDQPILQRGAQWKKTREEQSQAKEKDNRQHPTGHADDSSATRANSRPLSHTSKAQRHSRGTTRRDRVDATSDLFSYYNDLLNREFGDPDAPERPIRTRGGRSGARTYGSGSGAPRGSYGSGSGGARSPYGSGSRSPRSSQSLGNEEPAHTRASGRDAQANRMVFGSLADFGNSDGSESFDAADPYAYDSLELADSDDYWLGSSTSFGGTGKGTFGARGARTPGDAGRETRPQVGASAYSSSAWASNGRTQNAAPQPHGIGRRPYNSSVASHEPKIELPTTLRKLRDLENAADEQGEPLRGPQLFVAQAQLVADFEDDYQQPVAVGYHYLPTYAELTDAELRAYFTWRTQWRRGTATSTPAIWAMLMAYEFIDGVGCEPGAEVVSHLLKLSGEVSATAEYGSWSGVVSDLRRWARDYVVYYDLDPRLLGDAKDSGYGNAVMTYRHAERAILAEKGLVESEKNGTSKQATTSEENTPIAPATVPSQAAPATTLSAPSNEELWNATKALVSFDVDRSPFLRDHAAQAAAVWENVFSRMVVHCHKRRKVDYVDSLVGDAFSVPANPFVGVPFVPTSELREHTTYLNSAEWISYRFGRWTHHYGYSYASPDPGLGKLVHALDREMREVWDYPRKLKEKKIPRYQRTFLLKACEEVHGQELAQQKAAEEAERRKITFDFSKLGHIRAAAATTREALLVDEEREGYVPDAVVPQTAPSTKGVDTPNAASAASAPSVQQASTVPTPPDESRHQTQASLFASTTGQPAEAAATVPQQTPPIDIATATPQPNPQAVINPQPAQGQKNGESLATSGQETRPLGLTELEYQAALLMLGGKSIAGLLKPGDPSEDMLVDSINEKFFDELGDAAFEFGDAGPTAVEDYAEDIRALLNP